MIQQLSVLLLLASIVCGSSVTHPNINFDPIQQLTLSGSFDGISIYKDTRQLTTIPQNTSSVISLSNDTLQLLATSNINGTIYDACTLNGQLIIAGNFTSINGDNYNNIAAVDLNSNAIKALQKGLDGPVASVLCDTNTVYIGGSFIAPSTSNMIDYTNSLSTFGGSVAIWKNNQFTGLPWKGLNGPVNSIIKNKKNQIIFGGKFDTTTDGQSFHSPTSQPISIPASGVAATSGTNPSSILCSTTSGSAWQLTDGQTGTWQASFINYNVNPSLVRIANSKVANHQTKEFSIRPLTDSSVNYPLAYLDPVTGIASTCRDNCTLSNNPSVSYQDFRILNQTLTSGIAIDIKSWYGTSGGLSFVQVFQSEIFVYAVDTTSATSPCTSGNTTYLPKVTTTSTWTKSTDENTPAYLSYPVKSKTDSASITFYPNLVESGIYEVLIYTPACATSGCTDRTDIDVTIATASGTTISNITMSQKNTGSTSIYTGYFDSTSTGFEPNIKFSLASNATFSGTTNMVAFAIQFIKTASNDQLSSLLQYNSTQTNITMTSLSWGALPDNVPYKSLVQTMQLSSTGDVLYIGGNFTGTDKTKNAYNNIVSFDSTTNQLKALTGAGLNGPVQTLALGSTGELYVGGSFTGTKTASSTQLSYIARYNTQSATWSALDGGVNGPVSSINALSNNNLLISGNFTQFNTQQQTTAGNVWWNSQSGQWISDSSVPYLSGIIYNAYDHNNVNYFMGNVKSASRYQSHGISVISSADTLTSPAATFSSPATTSTSSTSGTSAGASINAGVFYSPSSTSTTTENITTSVMIFGGSFSLANSIQNIAMYFNTNQTWSGFQGADDWKSGQINSMAVNSDLLYVGGRFTGSQTNNLAIFNLSNKSLSLFPNVKTNDGSPANVNIIRSIPQQNIMVVGGNFSSVGSLTCSSVCAFNTGNLQWNSLGIGLAGEVSDMLLVNNKLVASGNFTLNNSSLPIAQFDFTKNTWGPFGTAELPGPSQYLSYDNITNHLYISGQSSNSSSAYLRIWDGQLFNEPAQGFKAGTVISKLSILPLVNATSPQNILLATGYINLGTLGNVSAAFYDGQTWIPYLVTSNANGDGTSSLNNMFYLDQQPFIVSVIKHFLPTPIVILVSIAVSLGIVFLIVLGAMIVVFIKKRRDAKVNPQSNPATYYGKPPRTPASLLTMLKETSPQDDNDEGGDHFNNNFSNGSLEKYGAHSLEPGTQQMYNMSRSISTDHLQEQTLTPFNGLSSATAMTTARAAPLPPTAHPRSVSNHNNHAFMPSSTTTATGIAATSTYHNAATGMGGTAALGLGAIAMGGTAAVTANAARPESYARPISEYQRDTDSFYNITSPTPKTTGREMAEVPNRNSYNPFRNSDIGVAVSNNSQGGGNMGAAATAGAAALAAGAFSNNNKSPSGYNNNSKSGYQQQAVQKGHAVTYGNIPPANTSEAAISTNSLIIGDATAAAIATGAFATADSRNMYNNNNNQGGTSQNSFNNLAPPQNASNLSVGTPESVRWTTTTPDDEAAATSYAVVKPISLVGTSDESSLVDPISGPQGKPRSANNKSKNIGTASSATSGGNVQWTNVPSSKDALATAFVVAAPVITVHGSEDDDQQSNHQSAPPGAASTSSLSVNNNNNNNNSNGAISSSSNVRWTNFNPSNALGVATVEPMRESLYNDHDSFYSPGPLKLSGSASSNHSLLDVNTTSEGLGLSSDPDIVRWTTAPSASNNMSKAKVEPVRAEQDQEDEDDSNRVSGVLGKSQYQASLSSVAWPNDLEVDSSHAPKTHIDDEIAAAAAAASAYAATAGANNSLAAPHSNYSSYSGDVNTKVMHKNAFRLSDAGSLPPIDTNLPPTATRNGQQEALLSPDSAVRWKTANVGSPIETAYAPNILMEPATATVTRRSANEDDDAFENYYHPKPQQATIVPNISSSSSATTTAKSDYNNTAANSFGTNNNNSNYSSMVANTTENVTATSSSNTAAKSNYSNTGAKNSNTSNGHSNSPYNTSKNANTTTSSSSSKNNNKYEPAAASTTKKSNNTTSDAFSNKTKDTYKPVMNQNYGKYDVPEIEEPVDRKSEAIDDVIANRDLAALSMIIQDEEEVAMPSLPISSTTTGATTTTTTTATAEADNNSLAPTPTPSRSTPSPAGGAGAADGRAASKRMVEEYISSRNKTKQPSAEDNKKSKYKSDFKSVMARAIENNAKSPVATEENPHLYYAKFDFTSREHGELGFEKNDPIIVTDSSDDIWWMGYKADKSDGSYIQGVFPSNYVEIAVVLRD